MSDSVEQLGWDVERLRLIAEQIGEPSDTLLDGGEAAACLHAITTVSARALRALAAWHTSNAAELFDDKLGPDQDATALVRASAKELRAFAGELEAAAVRHTDLIERLRRLTHPDAYEVTADEVKGEDEYYAIAIVQAGRASAAPELIARRYSREDVACSRARQLAHSGLPECVYRVVPVLEGERMVHVAQWAGEGYYGD